MILKMNGIALDPSQGIIPRIWNGISDFSGDIIENGAEHAVDPLLHATGSLLLHLNQQFISIMPELVVLIAVIFVGIGMFTNFGKWVSRGTVVYLGGAVWMILSKTVG